METGDTAEVKAKTKALTEAQIQAQIVKELGLRGWFVHSVPNEAAGRNYIRMGQLVAMGLRAGVADLVVWIGDGKVAYLEVKTPTGKQSNVQRTFERRCIGNGYGYRVVRSVSEAVEAVEEIAHEGKKADEAED